MRRGIFAKSLKRTFYESFQGHLLDSIEDWFEKSLLNCVELDTLIQEFPELVNFELPVFKTCAYVRWLFAMGEDKRAMHAISSHKILIDEKVISECIMSGLDDYAVQLIRNPGFILSEITVVPVEIQSLMELKKMKAEWQEGAQSRLRERQECRAMDYNYYSDYESGPEEEEEDEEFLYWKWEKLPITVEAKRIANMAGMALSAALKKRNLRITTELLVKGARANDAVWFDLPGEKEQQYVSTQYGTGSMYKSILHDPLCSFDDKKLWVGLLAQFGVRFDWQYYTTVFEMAVGVEGERERLHFLDIGAKHGANAWSHHLIDAMKHPVTSGYVKWWFDHKFDAISKHDIYLRGSCIARLPGDTRALVSELYGLKFPKHMQSHALDMKPTHEIGGECLCNHQKIAK